MSFYFNPYLSLKLQISWHHCGCRYTDKKTLPVTQIYFVTENYSSLIIQIRFNIILFSIHTSLWSCRCTDTTVVPNILKLYRPIPHTNATADNFSQFNSENILMPFYFEPYLLLKLQMCWHHCGHGHVSSSVTQTSVVTDSCLVWSTLIAFFKFTPITVVADTLVPLWV